MWLWLWLWGCAVCRPAEAIQALSGERRGKVLLGGGGVWEVRGLVGWLGWLGGCGWVWGLQAIFYGFAHG